MPDIVMDIEKSSIRLHKRLRGKIEIRNKTGVTRKNLPLLYTPGVAAASAAVARNRKLVFNYTMKWNSVAIVTDGSRVLGLGNVGPEAALPVMEGKAMLFKQLGGVDAFPICVATQKTNEIVETVRRIEPAFGGINLEDIDAPRCFEVEEALKNLGIPVFHDDQHGTAIAVLAALINAMKIVRKNVSDARIVVAGAGAAGIGTVKLLHKHGARHLYVSDSKGLLYSGRGQMDKYKKEISGFTNRERLRGGIEDALAGADAFIGVSGVPNLIGARQIRMMAKDPVVFALTNPYPDAAPADAKKGGAAVYGTGRSDLPNQINNSLVFPGIFRGALDARAGKISDTMKLAAADAVASLVKPVKRKILPNTMDRRVPPAVAAAAARAARADK